MTNNSFKSFNEVKDAFEKHKFALIGATRKDGASLYFSFKSGEKSFFVPIDIFNEIKSSEHFLIFGSFIFINEDLEKFGFTAYFKGISKDAPNSLNIYFARNHEAHTRHRFDIEWKKYFRFRKYISKKCLKN